MKAAQGDRVRVHYTLRCGTEEIIESSADKMPLEFTIGDERMLNGFEQGIIGMSVGESKNICIQSSEAHGPRDEKLLFDFDKSRAPQSFEPCIGDQVQLHRPDGKTVVVTVVGKTDKGYQMDANHPLAGRDLLFDITLLEIVKQSKRSETG